MKRLPFKFVAPILLLILGVALVSLWWYFLAALVGPQFRSEITSSVPPVKPVFENPCNYPQPPDGELNAEQAVYLAECFVIKNGYTYLPPAEKSQLTPENVFPGTDEEGLKMRRDSLERKAYSYRRSDLYGGSWVIMFEYRPYSEIMRFYGDRLGYIGRAVTFDYYGKDLRMQHSDYPLNVPDAVVINP